jgi:hypothetical protein
LSLTTFPNLVVNFSKIGVLEGVLVAGWPVVLALFPGNTIGISGRIISNLERGSAGC